MGPFDSHSRLAPGRGLIHLALLPPNTPRLRTVEYQYPLKLVSPSPIAVGANGQDLVHIVYLLTYGGGLVAGDAINLRVMIESNTRLTLLTQGSTKLFKSLSRSVVSKQYMTVELQSGSALCYLPDPVQPFQDSAFEQRQTYRLRSDRKVPGDTGSLCILDWVSNGRAANGEDWSFYHYSSRNEIILTKTDAAEILLLRDNIVLDTHGSAQTLTAQMQRMAVFGTLILHGILFSHLASFFTEEFKLLPRVGGQQWDANEDKKLEGRDQWRANQHLEQSQTGLLWSAASIRGSTVIKFCARELEHARHWLKEMLTAEGTVEAHFGEKALLCL